MAEEKVDIKEFSLVEISRLISHIGECQPHDLHVFRKFTDAAISQEFFSQFKKNIHRMALIDLQNSFSLNGEPFTGPTAMKYLSVLSKMVSNKEFADMKQSLVSTLWTLAYS